MGWLPDMLTQRLSSRERRHARQRSRRQHLGESTKRVRTPFLVGQEAYALPPKELRGGKQGDHASSDIHLGYAHGLSQQRRLRYFNEDVCPLANGEDKRWFKQSRDTITAGAVQSTALNLKNNAPKMKITSAVGPQRRTRIYKQIPAVQEALTTSNGSYPFLRAIGIKEQLADTLTKSADSQSFIQHRIK